MNVVQKYFKGIERDLTQVLNDKTDIFKQEGSKKARRVASLALRIFGGIGLAVIASSLIAGLATASTVSGVLPLIITTVFFAAVFHDSIVVGMNVSDKLDTSTTKDACTVNDYLRKAATLASYFATHTVSDHTPSEIRGTWIAGPIYRIVNN